MGLIMPFLVTVCTLYMYINTVYNTYIYIYIYMEVGECTPKDMSACSCRDDSMMGQRKENNGEGRRSALAYMRPCHSTCVEMMCSLVHSFLLQVPFAGQNQDPYHGKCDYHVGEFDPAFDK